MRYCLFLFYLLLSACFNLSAQGIEKVALKKFTQEDGLSSYYITKIIQDSYGFFWIGTQEGLNRFDGKNFTPYTRQSIEKHRLEGSSINDIVEDKVRGLLWIATSYGGVCGIDINSGNITRRIDYDEKGKVFSDRWIRSLCITGDTLWIGISGGLFTYDLVKNIFISLPKAISQLNTINVAKLSAQKNNSVWAFCDNLGIIKIEKDFKISFPFQKQLLKEDSKTINKLRFWNIATIGDLLFAATENGLKIINNSSNSFAAPTHTFLDSVEILSVTPVNKDKILVSTPKGFFSLDLTNNELSSYSDDNQNENNWFEFVYQSYFDPRSKLIWIGTQEGIGYFSEAGTPFKRFFSSRDQLMKLKHVYSVYPEKDSIVFCGDENGLYKVNRMNNQFERLDETGMNLMIFKGHEDIFVSNQNGLFLLDHKKLTPAYYKYPELAPLKTDLLNSGIIYNDSLICFSSVIQKGLSVWNTRSKKLDQYHQASKSHPVKDLKIINFLFKNRNGKLFILTEKDIIRLSPLDGHYISYKLLSGKEGSAVGNFMDMTETDSSYWIATYGHGIIETDKLFKVKRIFSTSNGLSNDCVYKVFEIKNNYILGTTNNGVCVINISDGRVRKYYQSDGLHSSAFEQSCGYGIRDEIFAGGVNGFTIINPALFKTNIVAPGLFVDHIKIECTNGIIDTSNLLTKEITVPQNYLRINLFFSALNYSNPSRINYEFKLDKQNWIQLGNNNFISLMGLGPGRYHLLVNASNEDNIWNEKPLELFLVIQPKYYQTWWFRSLLLIAFLGTIYLIYRNKINQRLKQEKIRRDIARDLHDDIGSTLNALKVYTHLAQTQPEKKEYLSQIQTSITSATVGLRDMIWVLDDTDDTFYGLVERINKIISPVAELQRIKFICILDEGLNNVIIDKTEKRNLLLITKEAVNNIIKYAGATAIEIAVKEVESKTLVTITDNGKGFDLKKVELGNGIRNMEERCKEIKYRFTLTSSEGGGTKIDLKKL